MNHVDTAVDYELRALTIDEISAAAPQVRTWLELPQDANLHATYPQVYQARGQARALGAFRDGTLCSHIAYRRVSMETDIGLVQATLIGDVATTPELRGYRMASTLLARVAQEEQDAGQDALILWSDLWDFYARLGFSPASVQAELIFRPGDQAHNPAVRPARPGDLLTITELHEQKPWRVHRDLHEMALLLSTAPIHCQVLERDGKVQAYAVHGKGIDLQGWWHEFGGEDGAVAELLPQALAQISQVQATIIVPPYRADLLDALSNRCEGLREGVVALCKPLSQRGLCEFFIDGLDSI